MERQISGRGGRAAGGARGVRAGVVAAAAAWSRTGPGLRHGSTHVAARIASTAGDRGGFFRCGAGDSRAASGCFTLRGHAHRARGAGGESRTWDSNLASGPRGSEPAVPSVFAGGLRELPAAFTFRSDRTGAGSRRRAPVRDVHGCAARISGWATKPKVSFGIRRAEDCVSSAAQSVLPGVARREGNCELDRPKGGLTFLECGGLAAAFAIKLRS